MSELIKKSVFTDELLSLTDTKYQQFSAKLIPTISAKRILGIRIPQLRKLAKHFCHERPEKVAVFLNDLPHYYYDENNLHGLIIAEQKNFQESLVLLDKFLPQIDNWASCDILRPKIFKKHKNELLTHIRSWLLTDHEYTVRFGLEMLMTHFLDKDFKQEYLQWVVNIRGEKSAYETYYVQMMIAWFLATALSKQTTYALPIIEQKLLQTWTHNMAIQKAIESRRISPEIKIYLQSLKKSTDSCVKKSQFSSQGGGMQAAETLK